MLYDMRRTHDSYIFSFHKNKTYQANIDNKIVLYMYSLNKCMFMELKILEESRIFVFKKNYYYALETEI